MYSPTTHLLLLQHTHPLILSFIHCASYLYTQAPTHVCTHHLFIHPSIHLSTQPSANVHLSIHSPTHLPITYLPIYRYTNPPIHLPIHISTYPLNHRPTYPFVIYPSSIIHPCTHAIIHLHIHSPIQLLQNILMVFWLIVLWTYKSAWRELIYWL